MRSARSAPVTFRIYPLQSRRPWVRVRIFDSASSMKATVRLEDAARGAKPKRGRRIRGLSQPGRAGREAATVNLLRRHLTVEILSHELLHAALFWACRARLPLWPDGTLHVDSEEVLCYAQSRMLWQCTDRLIRTGLATGEGLCLAR